MTNQMNKENEIPMEQLDKVNGGAQISAARREGKYIEATAVDETPRGGSTHLPSHNAGR